MLVKKISAISMSLLLLLTMSLSVHASATEIQDEQAIQNTIEEYYDRSYHSWSTLELDSFDDLIDLNSVQMKNYLTSLEGTVYRWSQIAKTAPEEVEAREKYDLFYDFDEISFSNNGMKAVVSVTLSGETEGTPTYPIFVSLGANMFSVEKMGGQWKITGHIYDDIILYEESLSQEIALDTDSINKELVQQNYVEVTSAQMKESDDLMAYPYTDYSYSASRAAAYAKAYCKSGNAKFYSSSKDCTNFVSQAVSYGFGSKSSYSDFSSYRMVTTSSYSTGWYAGSGGGSSSWEGVSAHWNYMTSSKTGQPGPRVSKIAVSAIKTGDVMQIDFNKDGTYDHTVICVDGSSGKFAQHTSNGFRYAKEYSGNKRAYYPKSFRVY